MLFSYVGGSAIRIGLRLSGLVARLGGGRIRGLALGLA